MRKKYSAARGYCIFATFVRRPPQNTQIHGSTDSVRVHLNCSFFLVASTAPFVLPFVSG